MFRRIFLEEEEPEEAVEEAMEETTEEAVEKTAKKTVEKTSASIPSDTSCEEDAEAGNGALSDVRQQFMLPFDDDEEPVSPAPVRPKKATGAQELVSQGVSFFTSLADTLSSLEKTEQLVNAIVKEDPQTGQTSIEIPVPDKESVSQMFRMLGKLMEMTK